MSNVASWGDRQVFVPPSVSKLTVRLLNEASTLLSPWGIPFGDVICSMYLGEQSLYVAEKFFLRFKCANELIQIALDDLSMLWVHPALSSVRYDTPLPEVVILPILEALLTPLKYRLENILHVPIIFLGFFNEPLVDYHFRCVMTLILDFKKLGENKSDTGIMRSKVPFRIYIPEGRVVNNFLTYLQSLPKKYIAIGSIPIVMGVRVGYSVLTLQELRQLSPGDILIPYDYTLLRNRISLTFLDKEIFCAVEGESIKLLSWGEMTIFPQQFQRVWTVDLNMQAKGRTTPLEMILSFEIGEYKTTVSELGQFIDGYRLMLETNIHSPITLSIQGRLVGTGLLIDFNGTVGVRIVEFFDSVGGIGFY